jgi:hypothetical protein
MNLFVSYCREDSPLVTPLVNDLGQLGHSVWMDRQLFGGQDWWDEILRQIASCDSFLLGLSPGMLDSAPCQLELQYADALRKPFLPVMVASVDHNFFPPHIAHAEYVDYTLGDRDSLMKLVGAMARLPPAPQLPLPLPAPPAMPPSPLYEISRQVAAPALDRKAQLGVLDDLEQFGLKPKLRDGVISQMYLFRNRPDIIADIRDRVDADLHWLQQQPAGAGQHAQPASSHPGPPAGPATDPVSGSPTTPVGPKAAKARFSRTFMVWMFILMVPAFYATLLVGLFNLRYPDRRRQAWLLIAFAVVWGIVVIILGARSPASSSGS